MGPSDIFESILIVFQNARPGRQESYDDWYTNVHIRDAMRLDGAIATQRFVAAADQPVLGGRQVEPGYFAHTIYEWESAAKSVAGHGARAGMPLMEITGDCSFEALQDYFYRPVFLSHGWSREAGFRRGRDILTALIIPPPGGEAAFIDWFLTTHVPDTLALPGFGSVGLFSLHEEQSLLRPSRFPLAAVYALTDRAAALRAWSERYDAGAPADLSARAQEVTIGCWQPRIARLRAEDVLNQPPAAAAAAEERRAREAYADRFLSQEDLQKLLMAI
jgi:hypothetical protein